MKMKKNEDVFFAREELEKKKKRMDKQIAKLAEDEKKQRKDEHFMHCPKCGYDLVEIKFRDVHIDKCTGCQGVWLDAGELEQVATEEDSFLNSMLKVFK